MADVFVVPADLSPGQLRELTAFGIISADGKLKPPPASLLPRDKQRVPKRAIRAPVVLNEPVAYPVPSSFSRGLRVDLGGFDLIFISGTASVDEHGKTAHAGDFKAQCWRTYRNITTLLAAEGATWHDVVRCTCYLRDIERDYQAFNEVRTAFFKWLKLDPLPASVGIQAILCRPDLLVEVDAQAIVRKNTPVSRKTRGRR